MLWDNYKRLNIHVTGVFEEGKTKIIFEQILAEKLPNLLKL